MKPNKKLKIFLVLVLIAAGVAAAVLIKKKMAGENKTGEEVNLAITNGTVVIAVKSTANVEPQNRLEVKPPSNGRIEEILVKEGDKVKVGQIIGWISSTERASLLDAAMAHGADELAYWKDVYKATPLRSPIDGEVIVRDFEPGQSISPSSAVVVLSDRLIVKASVDETDIGKVKVGQTVEITLDAYPDVKTKGIVDHISYESKLVNNVTTYYVDIVPEKVPDVFRSGMSATITVICDARKDVPLVPAEATTVEKDGTYVMVRASPGAQAEKRRIIVGAGDDRSSEVVKGLSAGDIVVVAAKKAYQLPSKDKASNPFMPLGSSGRKGRK